MALSVRASQSLDVEASRLGVGQLAVNISAGVGSVLRFL